MDLSIVIVNYNKYELTEKCVKSVLENVTELKYEIIIVDNNSTNESFEVLSKEFKELSCVKLIQNTVNAGFGAANNIAVNQCSSDIILFLNPDVIVLGDSIEKMYKKLLSDKEIGLMACKLLNEDMTLQYSCRRFMKFHEFIFCRTPFKKLVTKAYSNKLEDKYLMKDYDHTKELKVDWVMGSCMLIRKDLFNVLGGFNKKYFMYFEDVELCYNVHKESKKVLYYPEAEMIHMHRQESVKKINKLTFIHLKSMLIFYIKKIFG